MANSKIPHVDAKKCIACGACIATCPNQAIEWKDGKAWVNPKKCKKAYECLKVCPVKAIK